MSKIRKTRETRPAKTIEPSGKNRQVINEAFNLITKKIDELTEKTDKILSDAARL